jgi:hypothetical protein
MGNSSQGALLAGQVQGVRQGPGITINSDGTIEVNSQSIIGVMKMGQTAALAASAYNQYNWPAGTGTAGQQLTITSVAGGITNLTWGDPDQIPWTLKGQLVVGTGVDTQTILNVGTNGQILIADSGSTSGLAYTSNYVSTTGATGAANIPAGTAGQQPASPAAGALRYNSDSTSLEFWNGSGWETVASSTSNSFVEKTSTAGAAIIPAGLQTQRPGSPAAGYFRFNDDTDRMEFWDGFAWTTVASSTSGNFVSQTVPVAPATATPNAVIPAGSTPNRQTSPAVAAGEFRYNTTIGAPEYYDGANWLSLVAAGGSSSPTVGLGLAVSGTAIKLSVPVRFGPPAAGTLPAEAIDGSLYWDNNLGLLFIRYNDGTSTQWVQVTPSGGGGGGGGVTSVAVTAPITNTGSATAPVIGISAATSGAAGSMSAADKAKLDGAATIVSSVTVTGANGITTTGSPITSSGTITVSFPINLLTALP